ncbi:hypothetical protein ACTFIV_010682 [Dictyostelium citrinum]
MSIVDKNPKFNLYPKRSSLDVCTIVYNILVVEESNTNIIELVQFNSSFITPNPIKLILKDTNKSLYSFSIGQVIPGNYKLGLTATSTSPSSNFTLSFTCNLIPIYFKINPSPTETPSINPPKLCIGSPLCGGSNQGYCEEKVGCICYPPYIGKSCQSKVIIVDSPILNPTNPSTNLTFNDDKSSNNKSLIGLISIISLRELGINNEIEKTHFFEKWIQITLSNNKHQYITNLKGTSTNITIETEWFDSLTNITFLSKTSNVGDSTCSSQSFGETTSNENSNYIQLSVNEYSLFGRSIKRGIVDNKTILINNEQLNDLNSENSYFTSESYIGINIPWLKDLAQLDPDFSVLFRSIISQLYM